MDLRAGDRYHIVTWINGTKGKETVATSHDLGLLCRLGHTDVAQGKVFKVLLFAAISFLLFISTKSAKVPLFLPGFCLSLIKIFCWIIPAVLTPMPNIFSFCLATDCHHFPPWTSESFIRDQL